jgi:hypothetical protein
MRTRGLIVAGLASIALVAVPAVAEAEQTQTRTVGSVTATVSWKHNFAETRKFKIAIDRAGTRAFEAKVVADACDPAKVQIACPWPAGSKPLDLRDLDGDGEPEAIVGGFTGGAHCCVIAIVYRWDGATYVESENNFLDAGYGVDDLDGDGVYEFASRDARFAFLYGSFAESVFPIQIVGFDDGRFRDITAGFADAVAEDARTLRREYKRRAGTRRKLGVRSALAAYVADLFRLDRKDDANRVLERALERGLLERQTRFDFGPFGERFIRHLKRTLREFGYR